MSIFNKFKRALVDITKGNYKARGEFKEKQEEILEAFNSYFPSASTSQENIERNKECLESLLNLIEVARFDKPSNMNLLANGFTSYQNFSNQITQLKSQPLNRMLESIRLNLKPLEEQLEQQDHKAISDYKLFEADAMAFIIKDVVAGRDRKKICYDVTPLDENQTMSFVSAMVDVEKIQSQNKDSLLTYHQSLARLSREEELVLKHFKSNVASTLKSEDYQALPTFVETEKVAVLDSRTEIMVDKEALDISSQNFRLISHMNKSIDRLENLYTFIETVDDQQAPQNHESSYSQIPLKEREPYFHSLGLNSEKVFEGIDQTAARIFMFYMTKLEESLQYENMRSFNTSEKSESKEAIVIPRKHQAADSREIRVRVNADIDFLGRQSRVIAYDGVRAQVEIEETGKDRLDKKRIWLMPYEICKPELKGTVRDFRATGEATKQIRESKRIYTPFELNFYKFMQERKEEIAVAKEYGFELGSSQESIMGSFIDASNRLAEIVYNPNLKEQIEIHANKLRKKYPKSQDTYTIMQPASLLEHKF